MMKRASLWLLIAIATAGTVWAQNSKTARSSEDAAIAEQIKKLEHDRIQAGVRKDVAYVAAATADEYVQIDWDGRVLDKAAMLARIKSSAIQLQSNTLDEISVRVYGETAVVTGLATRKGLMDGKDISTGIRYTRVYTKRDGRWQVVQFQQTRVTPTAG
jgi:ketosteroid isomerase-like protein